MKQIKLLGVMALALTLGLSACGSANNESVEKCKTHKWGEYTTVKAATCTEDGQQERVCSVCGEKQTKVIKAAHTWGEYVVKQAASCSAVGQEERECSVCHAKEQREIEKLPHTFLAEAEDVWTPVSEPTCTEPGSHTHECQVCHEAVAEEIPATGHKYEKVKDAEGQDTDEDVVVWTTEPTCEHAGEGTKTCLVCHAVEAVTAAQLDHEFVPGDDSEPAPGETVFHEFTCKNGCGRKYLGFKANEVTDESKERLVIGTDGGARFWGRPIGNAIALSSDGTSVNQQNYECVYSTAEQGDFFEYKFTLDAETAAQLANCRCYADAKPAAYLAGQDFWACDESADEWTPGYYIDGADEHVEKDDNGQDVMVNDHALPVRADDGSEAAGAELDTQVKMGKRISNYRYILYVDGEVCAFDPEIKAPVGGSANREPRAEYVMPYTFHFTAGTHTISLRMAGGYRSTFYNFFFRAVEETPAE